MSNTNSLDEIEKLLEKLTPAEKEILFNKLLAEKKPQKKKSQYIQSTPSIPSIERYKPVEGSELIISYVKPPKDIHSKIYTCQNIGNAYLIQKTPKKIE
jgi:hypothetical protein